jgi:transcription elongation GreA/GreB family factor
MPPSVSGHEQLRAIPATAVLAAQAGSGVVRIGDTVRIKYLDTAKDRAQLRIVLE